MGAGCTPGGSGTGAGTGIGHDGGIGGGGIGIGGGRIGGGRKAEGATSGGPPGYEAGVGGAGAVCAYTPPPPVPTACGQPPKAAAPSVGAAVAWATAARAVAA